MGIKKKIQAQNEIPLNQLHLFFSGTELGDHQILQNFNVHRGSVFHLKVDPPYHHQNRTQIDFPTMKSNSTKTKTGFHDQIAEHQSQQIKNIGFTEKEKRKPIPQEVKMETESNDLNIPQEVKMETKSDDLKILQKAVMETKSDDLKISQKAVMETKSDDLKIPQKAAMETKSDDLKIPQKAAMETKSDDSKIPQKIAMEIKSDD